MPMRQFPEGLPSWLRRPASMEEVLEFYKDSMDPDAGWHGPRTLERYLARLGYDLYLSPDRNAELIVQKEDPLDREELEPRFILSYGPGMVPPNADHHFSSENWEFVLDKLGEWDLRSPG